MALRSRSLRFLLAFITLSIAATARGQGSEDSLVLGVFPRRNATETTQLFTPLAEHLAEKIGRRIQLVTSKDFESFWRGVTERRYDVVHYNQYHYIRSANAYQVIAHIEEASKSTIAGAIYVRKDSGIKELAQLRGRKVLFGGGEDAMISYITNLYLMQQAGLKKSDFNSVFAINPPNSILGVYHHQADAAGAGDGVLELPVVKNAINTDELIALAVSEPLLQLPIAVKRSMPAKLRAQIQSTLVALKDTAPGRQVLKSAVLTGIVKAEDKDYDAHRKIVRAVLGAEALQQR